MHGLLTQKSGSHSHFVTALPVLILVSLSSSFLTLPSDCIEENAAIMCIWQSKLTTEIR